MAEESIFAIVPKSKLDWIESVLQQVQQVINNNTRTSKLEDEWVSSEEARKVLGVSVSVSTMTYCIYQKTAKRRA